MPTAAGLTWFSLNANWTQDLVRGGGKERGVKCITLCCDLVRRWDCVALVFLGAGKVVC